ncbi:ATP-binding protein [uncultured Martelella sp.]|uniref:sensor histidine kinase n=1 Tax=uncultured Martelella sp. TaxID=392331 RepID=UPI0029C85DD2|nr:ATP-binding protein [uncultured Martelella sp.]
MRRLLPRTLRGQIIALIVLALALAQALTLWLFVDQRALAVRSALAIEAADRAGSTARLLEDAPAALRPEILQAASSSLVQFTVSETPSVTSTTGRAPSWIERRIRTVLSSDDPRTIRVDLRTDQNGPRPPPGPAPGFGPGGMHHMGQMRPQSPQQPPVSAVKLDLSIALDDGSWLNVTSRFRDPPYQWVWSEALPFAITAGLLAAVLWVALSRLIGPLRTLGTAADRLGRGEDIEPIAPKGPEEMRQLATSFNEMQARLDRFVRERTQLLGALGHDLRSPLTALRVRAEMVDDDETRDRMIATIVEMQEMVEATLSFSRGMALSEPVETIDLQTFLNDLVEELHDAGNDITVNRIEDANLRLRSVSMRRAIRNLIENAVRYGHRANISASTQAGSATILIEDEGPGIPEDEMHRVFEPFVRLETSRSRETGGVGLGLSIARTIILAHGGSIALENRPAGNGLRVTVTLPLEKPA